MRVLGLVLCILIIINVCYGGKRNHEKHQRKNHHNKKADRHGNHHNGVNGKLDIHRADGCHCPKPDEVCVEGKATGGGPICVTAKFMKNGKRLLKEFNHHKSEGFKLKDKEPKPHHFKNHHIDKPHNVHIDVYSKPTNHQSKHHKKGKGHHEDKLAVENQCTADDMTEMRQRLAGWFRLIHAQDRESHPHRPHHGHHKHNKHLSVKKELRLHHHEGKCKCLKSVMWEFRHLDENKNHFLNQNELREIERNNMEPCLRPYLDSCDHNKDGRLSRNEWCCCFSDVLPPCYKELRNLREKLLTEDKDMILPKCDHEGFYAKEQCKGEHNKPRTCWCVDLNGNKVPHTESLHRAHCGHYNVLGLPKTHH